MAYCDYGNAASPVEGAAASVPGPWAELSDTIPYPSSFHHRVVGSGGSLTGYADGIDKKVKLLELEKADLGAFQALGSICL
ncbi:MAG: MGMT family protein [Eisenbergiella sp.]